MTISKEEASEIIKEYPALAAAVQTINENHPGGFISLVDYTATSGRTSPETSSYVINGNVIYANVLRRSIEMAREITAERLAMDTAEVNMRRDPEKAMKVRLEVNGTFPYADAALSEEIMSMERRLAKIEDGEAPDETHYELMGAGCKRHRDSDTLHIQGLLVTKRISIHGVYKQVNSNPKTLCKKELKRQLPIGKWRQFRLGTDNFDHVAVAGQTIRKGA